MKNQTPAGPTRGTASSLFDLFLSLTLLTLAGLGVSRASAPLEVYGRLPSIENVALSPDGTRLAYVHTDGDNRLILLISVADHKPIAQLRVGSAKLRSLRWADEDNLMLTTSLTGMAFGFVGNDHEWYQLQVYNVKSNRIVELPRANLTGNVKTLSFLWDDNVMVRYVDGHTILFVTGMYTDELDDTNLPALFRCDLTGGVTRLLRQGSRTTQSWLVDDAGEVLAEEDYDVRGQRWAVKIRRGRGLEEAASGAAAIDVPALLGFGPTSDTLLMEILEKGDPLWRLMSMKDGSLGIDRHALHGALLAPAALDSAPAPLTAACGI